MFHTERSTIYIASTPRSGSTVLMDYIATKSALYRRCFLEPDYDLQSNSMKMFETYFDLNKKFILKAHAINLGKFNPNIQKYLLHSNDVYRIKISRKNIVEQIVSFYVSVVRGNKWHYFSDDYQSEILPIDRSKLLHISEVTINANAVLESLDTHFDLILDYTDVQHLSTAKFKYKTPQPLNYSELLDVVTSMITISSEKH